MTTVSSGQTLVGFTVSAGLEIEVQLGGKAISTTILSNGSAEILGVASSTTISEGGFAYVFSGGVDCGTLVLGIPGVAAGLLTIQGGTDHATTLSGFSSETVDVGGIAYDTTVSAGGYLEPVSEGQPVGGTTIDAMLMGGVEITDGGTTSGTVIRAGGVEVVGSFITHASGFAPSAPDLAFGTVVSSGRLLISSGSVASGTTVLIGGTDTVSAGGSAVNTLVAGGRETVSSGGTATGTTVVSGFLVVASGGTASNVLVSGGGTEVISSGGTAASTDITQGGAIDVVALAYTSTGSVVFNPSADTATIVEGIATATLQLIGDYSGDIFNLGQASDGSTLLTARSIACYCVGTLILTKRGEVAVEALNIGDIIVTASGNPRPIKWIGRRSYAGRFLLANPGVQPIIFLAGSLGGGLPRRDLRVSPKHAMFFDGLLVPAECLVNGSSIVQERRLAKVDYCHVELDSHDVLLAEGAPSESFIDDDSRGLFHNAREFALIHPNASDPGQDYAPRATEGYKLEAIRRRLAEVAGRIMAAA